MAPTPSKTPLKTPQSKHRSHFNSVKHIHPSLNPNSTAKDNPPTEHPVEVVSRIRDYPDQKDKPVSALQISSDRCSIRVRTEIGYRDFSLDGVSASEEEDLDGFYKKFVESRINAVKLGEKCTIMMYGPTGSGKSHTMFGCPKQPGIVYRALKNILGESEEEAGTDNPRLGLGAFVQVSVLEIYNEEIYDLLSSNSGGGLGFGWPKGNSSKVRLEVMGKKAKNATFISGNEAGKISREVAKVEKRRIVKSTLCNERSSRSHCMIILDVPMVGGRLMLVDMAGSENIDQAGQIGFEAKMQTAKINQGNIALKRVVESIANGDSHVPFRDSKLTMLLQDSFEDDKSKILMILCASPDPKELHKTMNTLEYGAKAKCIVRGGHTPTKDKVFSEDPSAVILGSRIAAMDEFIFKLQMENKRKEKERNEAHKMLMRKEEEVAALRAKLQAVEGKGPDINEELINLKVKERTRVLNLELENKLEQCQKMANEFVELGKRRMEEKIMEQQQEVEMLRWRLEEIECELYSSKDDGSDKGSNFAKRLLEMYSNGDQGMEKSMDLDMGNKQPVIIHDVKEVEQADKFSLNLYHWNPMEEEDDSCLINVPRCSDKISLSTVFEEDEGDSGENTEEEEVENKEVVEETEVPRSTRINFNTDSFVALENRLMHTPKSNSCQDFEEKRGGLGLVDNMENSKDPVSARKTRIQNIFMLCGNQRELTQHVATPAKESHARSLFKEASQQPEIEHSKILSDATCKLGGELRVVETQVNRSRSSSETAFDSKENNRPEDSGNTDGLDVYVKWEASKDYPGKFITKLKLVKGSSLADLRKLIEIHLGEDQNMHPFTFLMLGDPTGAPVGKDKEATVQASKLPICNNQLSGHLACLRPVRANQLPNNLPFSSLENKLQQITLNSSPPAFTPKVAQNFSPASYVTTGGTLR